MSCLYSFVIGGLFHEIYSDLLISFLNATPYTFFSRQTLHDADISIIFLALGNENQSIKKNTLSLTEKKNILQTVGFKERWFHYPCLTQEPVFNAIRKCAKHPDYIQIEFTWNRVLIRDFYSKTISVFYHPTAKNNIIEDEFHAIYRNLFAPLLFSFFSAILHASGVIFSSGKSALFFAPDSGGKSTLVSTFDQEKILSDDQVVVKKSKGTFQAFGTPFGRVGNNVTSGQLGGLFFLEKNAFFSIQQKSKSQAFMYIWNEHKHFWPYLPIRFRKAAFHLITDLVQTVPTYTLTFPKDHVDWDAIEKALA